MEFLKEHSGALGLALALILQVYSIVKVITLSNQKTVDLEKAFKEHLEDYKDHVKDYNELVSNVSFIKGKMTHD